MDLSLIRGAYKVENVTINKKPEPEIDVGKRNDVGFDNQNILPQSDSEIRIYQELTVNRNPTFSMAGLSEFKQEFKAMQM